MRLAPAQLGGFLRQPDPAIRGVLLYGPDAGLVRERADMLARAILPDLHDPFRVADLSGATLAADPARLADEAAAMSLTGGRRVVRIREAGDALAALFAGFLDTAPGDALVTVEAGDLPQRSSLRRVFDEARRAASIGCYPDSPRDLAVVIRESLAVHRVTASPDAVQYLIEHLGGDRLLTRSELDKLSLYAGDGGRVELDDARLSVGDSAALSLDDAIQAAAEGDAAALERALDRVLQEGDNPVTIIRAALRHLQRLQLLAGRVAGGSSIDETIRSARPPVFYKQAQSFKRQLAQWDDPRLRTALDLAAGAEFAMKQTGSPAETLCRAALHRVAQLARRPRGR
jgi:DNA polymerase-3 subunit delta